MSDTDQKPITLTEVAATEAKEVIASTNDKGFLRLWVSGGGCSGLSYGLGVDEDLDESDLTFESYGVKIAVDPISYPYVAGSVIGYQVGDNANAGFSVDNPNALSSCGCRQSFQTEDSNKPSGGCSGCGCQ